MKKRLFCLMLAALMVCGLGTGCSKEEEQQQGSDTPSTEEETVNRDMYFKDLGLAYTIPELWVEYVDTNLHMTAMTSDSVFGKITYSYVKDSDVETVLSASPLTKIDDYLYPVATIAIIHKDNLESPTAKELYKQYSDKTYVSYSGEYEYYLLHGSKAKTDDMTDLEKAKYDFILAGVPALKDSIVTHVFDDQAIHEQADRLNRTITFVTKTLEGEDINSTVFADYDVTMLNFIGTYAYEKLDESEVLQEVYETFRSKYPNINLIQAVVDTPDAEAEALALEKKTAAGATYTSIVLDELLANWVGNNLPGVPCTIFIDKNGDIIGEQYPGRYTAEEYVQHAEKALEATKTEK